MVNSLKLTMLINELRALRHRESVLLKCRLSTLMHAF